MATKPERADDGKFHHGCGETFQHAAWYFKHALHCDGKPVQKRGRIERLAARAGKAITPAPTRAIVVARAPREERKAAIAPTTPALSVAAVAAAATDTAMDLTIAGLLARRGQIDVAIAALEALRA